MRRRHVGNRTRYVRRDKVATGVTPNRCARCGERRWVHSCLLPYGGRAPTPFAMIGSLPAISMLRRGLRIALWLEELVWGGAPDATTRWRHEVNESVVRSQKTGGSIDCVSAAPSSGRSDLSAKLREALDYLGDRLATHPNSRFKPARQYVLDGWRSAREAARRLPIRTISGVAQAPLSKNGVCHVIRSRPASTEPRPWRR